MINENFVQQGWQCPVCKRVYSPFTSCCFYCGSEGMTKTSTDWIEHQNEPYKEPNFTGTGYAPYAIEDIGIYSSIQEKIDSEVD